MTFLPGLESEFADNNDWVTPEKLARFAASLVEGKKIVEPGAGTGAITRFLPAKSIAIERNSIRLKQGEKVAPNARWIRADYLSLHFKSKVDCVIANPPFSSDLGFEFIRKSLEILREDGKLILILPSTYFQTEKARKFIESCPTKFSFSDVFQLTGRVAYIRNGVPIKNRQCYDAVFVIVPYITTCNFDIVSL